MLRLFTLEPRRGEPADVPDEQRDRYRSRSGPEPQQARCPVCRSPMIATLGRFGPGWRCDCDHTRKGA